MTSKTQYVRPQTRKSPRLGITQQNGFVSRLASKICLESMTFSVKLRFEPSKIVIESNRHYEYEDGRFIARSFLRAGIKEITLREIIEAPQQIKELLEAAERGFITPLLPKNLEQLNIVKNVVEVSYVEAQTLGIPGLYKHYTNHVSYQLILQNMEITSQNDQKNGKNRNGLYLTCLNLTPEEAHEVLFLSKPELENRGRFVVSFDILNEELKSELQPNGIEFFMERDVSLNDPRIRIRYFGPNYIQVAA